jgi:hypothetical protein
LHVARCIVLYVVRSARQAGRLPYGTQRRLRCARCAPPSDGRGGWERSGLAAGSAIAEAAAASAAREAAMYGRMNPAAESRRRGWQGRMRARALVGERVCVRVRCRGQLRRDERMRMISSNGYTLTFVANTAQHVATQHNTLQHSTPCCNTVIPCCCWPLQPPAATRMTTISPNGFSSGWRRARMSPQSRYSPHRRRDAARDSASMCRVARVRQ